MPASPKEIPPRESRPREIWALDWGATAAKRQLCRAVLRGGRYSVERPEELRDPASLDPPPGSLLAFDCPLGFSEAYAEAAALPDFRGALSLFGRERFSRFYEPAEALEEVSPERPFFPGRRGAGSQAAFRERLGEAALSLRACDRATGAGPLFWLVGAKQVGRSAISVWRDVLTPRLEHLALWPFDGTLAQCLATGRPVAAEMYPRFCLLRLGVSCPSKRDPAARKACGEEVLRRTEGVDLVAVRELLLDGFGSSPAGEDAFDATISAITLAWLATRGELTEPPAEARRVEGWILGL